MLDGTPGGATIPHKVDNRSGSSRVWAECREHVCAAPWPAFEDTKRHVTDQPRRRSRQRLRSRSSPGRCPGMDNTTDSQNPARVVTTGTAAAVRKAAKAQRLGVAEASADQDTRREDRDAARTWLATYVPKDVDARTWSAIRDFVVECVERLVEEHEVTHEAVRRTYIRSLVMLACYCRSTHQALQVATALDPYTVNQFATAAKKSAPESAATYQSRLRYLGELLNPSPLWERPAPVARRSVAVPYSLSELAVLRSRIAHNSPARRRGGEGLMTLGLGAGLDGRWAAEVTKEDVLQDIDGFSIVVDDRIVPVLHAYENALGRLLEQTPDEGLLVGGQASGKNAANAIAGRVQLGQACPALNAGRVRSTWLVTHLALGTRLPELAAAAGMVGVTTLSDLLEFVPPLACPIETSYADAVAMLRGPR